MIGFVLKAVLWLIIAITLSYFFQYLVSGVFQTDNTETVGKMADTITPILTCLMLSVFTPVIEELTFRESIIGVASKGNRRLLLVMTIVSIVVFDCIHLYRWQEFFYYLPLSIALTLFYVNHNRNIFSSIIMHSIANLPGALLLILGLMWAFFRKDR